MLHPAQSINLYQKAPTLVMEYTDVPLIDRKEKQNKWWEGMKKIVRWRKRENAKESTIEKRKNRDSVKNGTCVRSQ